MNHNEMFLSQSSFEELSCQKNKITAIIATSDSPLKTLAWSVLSLLLRSGDCVENVHVLINGPVDNPLQDKKQLFLNKLRSAGLPITVQRVYGHVGHANALDSMIPWVNTEFYLAMHDDLIVLDDDWTCWFNLMKDEDERETAILYDPPFLMRGIGISEYEGGLKLALPHLNSTFMICRKSAFKETGASWRGYHVRKKFNLMQWKDLVSFLNYHIQRNHVTFDYKKYVEKDFDYLNVDIGGWAYYLLSKAGFKFSPIKSHSVYHLRAASWFEVSEQRFDQISPITQDLEYQIKQEIPEIFSCYCDYTAND